MCVIDADYLDDGTSTYHKVCKGICGLAAGILGFLQMLQIVTQMHGLWLSLCSTNRSNFIVVVCHEPMVNLRFHDKNNDDIAHSCLSMYDLGLQLRSPAATNTSRSMVCIFTSTYQKHIHVQRSCHLHKYTAFRTLLSGTYDIGTWTYLKASKRFNGSLIYMKQKERDRPRN